MREVSVEFLKEEAIRLGAVVVGTRVLHPSGLKVHGPGEALTISHVKLLQELGIRTLVLLEPGEGEQAALRALSSEMVRKADLAAGNVLAEDVRGADRALVAPAGAVLDPDLLRKIHLAAGEQVTIRRRGLEAGLLQARQYLGALPPAAAHGPRPDTRVTQATRLQTVPVRPLLVPRARVIVCIRDDFHRAVLLNTLSGEGHEVSEHREADAAAKAAANTRPDVLLVDLADALPACRTVRAVEEARAVSILVCAPEGRTAEVHQAVLRGANDSLPFPPRREALLEKVRGAMQAMGRASGVKPAVQTDRRRAAREPGHFVCGLADKFISKPLPVTSATVLDVGEGGIRIEYAAPLLPNPFAYAGHAVHPAHFWYNYSKSSALGRDLTVTIPAPGATPLEAFARFVHVARSRDYEVAGLVFQRVRGSVRDQITVIRGNTERRRF